MKLQHTAVTYTGVPRIPQRRGFAMADPGQFQN